ncbi:MAG: hypothetical protein LLG14_08290 [Nocardiaceae bacterium]|nr:hypothetical protein [Nocardiaceae bacterium]
MTSTEEQFRTAPSWRAGDEDVQLAHAVFNDRIRRGDDPDLIRKLVDVAIRLHHRFSPGTTFAEVLTVVGSCRRDLDIASSESLPELAERLAAQRLLDTISKESGP